MLQLHMAVPIPTSCSCENFFRVGAAPEALDLAAFLLSTQFGAEKSVPVSLSGLRSLLSLLRNSLKILLTCSQVGGHMIITNVFRPLCVCVTLHAC